MFMKKWRQHLAAILANHTTLVAGLVLGWTSPVLPVMDLSYNEESWVASLALLGALVGAVPAGCLTDRLGRKRFLLTLSLPFLLGWGLIVAALWGHREKVFDMWMLYVGRFICGLAVGATTVAVPLYTNEIAEDKVRGALGVYLDMMLTTGILVVYCLGAAFDTLVLTAICCATCPVLALAFLVMPESPTYLLACGKPEKSERALRWLRVRREDDTEIQLELARIRSIVEHSTSSSTTTTKHGPANGHPNGGPAANVLLSDKEAAAQALQGAEAGGASQVSLAASAPASGVKPALKKMFDHVTGRTPTGKAFFIVMGLMTFMQLSGIDAVIFYLGEIFEDAGSTMSPLNASIVVGAVQVVANVSSAIAVDRIGRRVLLILSESLMAASLASLALYFHLRDDRDINVSENYGWVPVVALSVFVWVFAFGIGSLPWFMMAELLPTEAQDWGSSSAICLNWSLGFLVTNVFSSMVRDMGGAATYGVFCTICVIGTFFMAFLVPETKGRSPDEIQRLLEQPTRCLGIRSPPHATKDKTSKV
ncbi:facilitated trehalose transporter Tret1-2 homolog [Frankliniella occidentalis]|uniref:Facilitated trehalose transporter Tret1-2 homolog n=1 Tax=Frankliniella occidentalis TaxID=133901 RepID=A0A6J1SH94_FRAOC|nr:facilitated trehalose transporter Tret1-2 homolog [Frankliniella occidentalis]XP_052124959.1 facilitated trehalose transporter Tret1-2 homolog [Frankliniella occidentalis]